AAQPGQLLGPDAWLSQLGRGDATAGGNPQAGEQDGAVPCVPPVTARAAPRRLDARVVQADQASPRLKDRAGGGDAASGDDRLADALAAAALHDGRPGALAFVDRQQEQTAARRRVSAELSPMSEIET